MPSATPTPTHGEDSTPTHLAPLTDLSDLQNELAEQAAEITTEINTITSLLPSSITTLEPAGNIPAKSPHQHLLDIEITVQSAHLTLQRLSAATKSLRRALGREILHRPVIPSTTTPSATDISTRPRTLKELSRQTPCTAVWGESGYLPARVEETVMGDVEGVGARYPSPPPCGGNGRKRYAEFIGGEGKGDEGEEEVLDCRLIVLKRRRLERGGE